MCSSGISRRRSLADDSMLRGTNSPGNSPGAAAPGINDENLLVYRYSGLVQPIGLVDYLSLKKSI